VVGMRRYTYMDGGPALRRWRKRLGLTQRKAAEALGLSLRGYATYEYGEMPTPLTVLLAAAAIAHGIPSLRTTEDTS